MWNFFKANKPDTANLEKEVKSLRRQNLRLKMHMQVLVSNSYSRTADRIRYVESQGELHDSIVNLN